MHAHKITLKSQIGKSISGIHPRASNPSRNLATLKEVGPLTNPPPLTATQGRTWCGVTVPKGDNAPESLRWIGDGKKLIHQEHAVRIFLPNFVGPILLTSPLYRLRDLPNIWHRA